MEQQSPIDLHDFHGFPVETSIFMEHFPASHVWGPSLGRPPSQPAFEKVQELLSVQGFSTCTMEDMLQCHWPKNEDSWKQPTYLQKMTEHGDGAFNIGNEIDQKWGIDSMIQLTLWIELRNSCQNILVLCVFETPWKERSSITSMCCFPFFHVVSCTFILTWVKNYELTQESSPHIMAKIPPWMS